MDFLHVQYPNLMPYWRHSKKRTIKRIYLNTKGLSKNVLFTEEASSPQKRTSITSEQYISLFFFLCGVILFTWIRIRPIKIYADPDPNYWKKVNKNYVAISYNLLRNKISVNRLRARSHIIFPIVSETISYIWEKSQRPSVICSLPSTIAFPFRPCTFFWLAVYRRFLKGDLSCIRYLPSFLKLLIVFF